MSSGTTAATAGRGLIITGASGLIGRTVAPDLSRAGWHVIPARRGSPRPGEAHWDPRTGALTSPAPFHAVLHLAGASLFARRWTRGFKQVIRASRVEATRALSTALASRDPIPETLVTASAAGFYGDQKESWVDEHHGPGSGFLADVTAAWEAACAPAARAGIRVVHLRFGLVLSRRGGALGPLLPLFRLGLGGPIGAGRQFWSWIGAEDLRRVVREALANASLRGPVNAVAPEARTQREFAKTLGRVLHRPALFPVPAFLLRFVLGEMADEMLLVSTRVRPARLTEAGFRWRHPDLEGALRSALEE